MKLFPTKPLAVITLLLSTPGLTACSSPQHRANDIATKAGWSKRLAQGENFEHLVYENDFGTLPIRELHIYIEGDGTPWIAGRYPAVDPTPERPIALEMMTKDPAPAIYLGRPCYFGLEKSANCSAQYWTSRRYSPEVVASMLSVISRYRQLYDVQNIVLIGYSGGGALAALLARDVPPPGFLFTVSANLDTDLWTELRGFLPLEGSLNPIDFRVETAQRPQLHLAGLQDRTVPAAVTQSYTSGLAARYSHYYPDFDHSCCWLDLWPDILAKKPWAQAANK